MGLPYPLLMANMRLSRPFQKEPNSSRNMRRLIFLNRYFFPDHSATSQMLSDLTFHLAKEGRDVHVITSRQHYDDPHAELAEQETIGGVRVHRVASTRFGRKQLLGRGSDYL